MSLAPVTVERPRCWRCGRVFAYRVTRPYEIQCSKQECKAINKG